MKKLTTSVFKTTNANASYSRRDALKLGALAIAGTGLGVEKARSAETVTMRLGSDSSAGHPYNLGLDVTKAEIEATTNGRVTVQIFPDAQLGGEEAMTNGLKIGTIDGLITSVGVMVPAIPQLAIFDLPFMFRNPDHLVAAARGPIAEIIEPQIKASYNSEVIGWGSIGSRNIYNSRHPVIQPSDLAGLKMRVSPGPIHQAFYSSLGALPVSIPLVETYSALQTGVADGCDIPITDVVMLNLNQVTKYLTRSRHAYLMNTYLVSDRFMSKISVEDQAAVRAACAKGMEVFISASKEQEESGIGTLVERGMKVDEIADREAFVIATEPVLKQNIDTVGGAEFIDKIKNL